MPEEKIDYITGALHKVEKLDEKYNEITFYDDQHTYFADKSIQMKVGCGYKLGIKNTAIKDRHEIVSVEQNILAKPAFEATAKTPTGEIKVVQIPLDDYKDLVYQKNFKVREACLKTAIEVCDREGICAETFKREVLKVARELEAYFE